MQRKSYQKETPKGIFRRLQTETFAEQKMKQPPRRLFGTSGALRERAPRPRPRETFCGAKIRTTAMAVVCGYLPPAAILRKGNARCALAKTYRQHRTILTVRRLRLSARQIFRQTNQF